MARIHTLEDIRTELVALDVLADYVDVLRFLFEATPDITSCRETILKHVEMLRTIFKDDSHLLSSRLQKAVHQLAGFVTDEWCDWFAASVLERDPDNELFSLTFRQYLKRMSAAYSAAENLPFQIRRRADIALQSQNNPWYVRLKCKPGVSLPDLPQPWRESVRAQGGPTYFTHTIQHSTQLAQFLGHDCFVFEWPDVRGASARIRAALDYSEKQGRTNFTPTKEDIEEFIVGHIIDHLPAWLKDGSPDVEVQKKLDCGVEKFPKEMTKLFIVSYVENEFGTIWGSLESADGALGRLIDKQRIVPVTIRYLPEWGAETREEVIFIPWENRPQEQDSNRANEPASSPERSNSMAGENTASKQAPKSRAAENNRSHAKTADEAVTVLGDEWATVAQLGEVIGLTKSSIRASFKRAKDRGDFLSTDEQDIPDSRPGTARQRYRIRGIWRHLSIAHKRSDDTKHT